MNVSLEFNSNLIEKAEKNFARLSLSEVQFEVIDNMANILCKFLPISRPALMGFLLKALKKAQIEMNIKIENESELEPMIRKEFHNCSFNHLYEELSKIITIKSEEQKALLDKAFKEIFEYIDEILE